MNAFLSDLIHDLREKRLWPVAAALVVAAIAVPVLLAKPAPSDKPASATPLASDPVAAAKDTVPVELAKVASGDDSKLEAFDPKNPFKPKIKPVNLDQRTANALSQIAAQAGGDAVGAGDTGGTGGGGGTGDTGGTGGTTPVAPTDPGTVKPQVDQYTYVLDVTFSQNGNRRRIKGMDKLSMLPSAANPALLFLGVTSGGDDAVFLVDSRLDAHGEGTCAPSRSQCATVALGAGTEHFFTDQSGNSYSLRIDEIRKVKVSTVRARAARHAKRAAKASVASAASDAAAPINRFVPPILTDVVTVATESTNRSSSHDDGR